MFKSTTSTNSKTNRVRARVFFELRGKNAEITRNVKISFQILSEEEVFGRFGSFLKIKQEEFLNAKLKRMAHFIFNITNTKNAYVFFI